MEIDLLEHGGICKILISLLSYPGGVKRVFYRNDLKLGSRASIRNHDLLFKAKLIENKPSKDQLLFGLTKQGKKIALSLQDIEVILKEQE